MRATALVIRRSGKRWMLLARRPEGDRHRGWADLALVGSLDVQRSTLEALADLLRERHGVDVVWEDG